ncbi:acyltransferase family protein [Sinimarinibacterium thermocellulolyticum]|uniref:Acyltransferase n=1 Tax=Sinimarinibacterium thermocellulolyticum TaxID=3170016 RepID=A0ABV2AAN0_9GAMM
MSVAREFNPNIHGLRGLAAFMVFWCHVYAGALEAGFYPEHWHPLLAWLLHAGRYGVDVFFMISGYLITESLTRKGQVRRFLADRAIRIYPAFLAVLLPLIAMGMLTRAKLFADTDPLIWPLQVLANLLFLPGVFDMPPILGVAWSLSFEAAFYLTAALAFALKRSGRQELAVAVCAGAGLLLFPQYPGVIFFYAGALIYLYRDALLLGLARVHVPFTALIALLAVWHLVIVHYHRAEADLSVGFAAMLLLSFVLGLLFFNGVVAGAGPFGIFLRSGALQFLGTISYSFYLWHTPVMFFTKRIVLHYVAPEQGDAMATLSFALLSLPPALLVSWISYRLFEAAAGRILHRRLNQQRTAASVAS